MAESPAWAGAGVNEPLRRRGHRNGVGGSRMEDGESRIKEGATVFAIFDPPPSILHPPERKEPTKAQEQSANGMPPAGRRRFSGWRQAQTERCSSRMGLVAGWVPSRESGVSPGRAT